MGIHLSSLQLNVSQVSCPLHTALPECIQILHQESAGQHSLCSSHRILSEASQAWQQQYGFTSSFSDNSDTVDVMFSLVQMSWISRLNNNELEAAQCVSTNKSKWNSWASGETNFK